jgi:hypothetical protein
VSGGDVVQLVLGIVAAIAPILAALPAVLVLWQGKKMRKAFDARLKEKIETDTGTSR